MQEAAQKTNVSLTVMIEGSRVDNNYSAYIPELRLGAVGDTVEEARENVLDLAKMEMSKPSKTLSHAPIIESVRLEV